MTDLNDIKQFDELQEWAALNGYKLNKSDYVRLADARDRAREEHRKAERQALSWHERLNQYLPSMQNAVLNLSMFVFVAARTVATTLLIPVVLVLVAIVETVRVAHGVELFEAAAWLAYLGAIALVASNIVLEFNIADIEHRAKYSKPVDAHFSLRIMAERFAYIFGIGGEWRRALHSPARRYHIMARWLKTAILLLAVAGSMRTMFESLSGNWQAGLSQIWQQSSLLQMVTWIGGLIFAAVVVSLTSTFTAYMADLAIEAESAMPGFDASDESGYVDRQAALELKAILSSKKAAQQAKNATSAPTVRFEDMNTDDEDTDKVATIRPT